jgi:hypothetical protein
MNDRLRIATRAKRDERPPKIELLSRLASPICANDSMEIDFLTDIADAEDRGQWSRAAQLRMWMITRRLRRG